MVEVPDCGDTAFWDGSQCKTLAQQPDCDLKTTKRQYNSKLHKWECASIVTPTQNVDSAAFFDCIAKSPAPASTACSNAPDSAHCNLQQCKLLTRISEWKCVVNDNHTHNIKAKSLCEQQPNLELCDKDTHCKVIPKVGIQNSPEKFDSNASVLQTFGRCVHNDGKGHDDECAKHDNAIDCGKTSTCKFETRRSMWFCQARDPKTASNKSLQDKCRHLNTEHDTVQCHNSGVCTVTPFKGFRKGEKWIH